MEWIKKYRISLIIFGLAILYGVLNMINGRFQMRDLQVYYDASMWLFDGASPYGRAFGLSSGYYKYSSTAALLFTPLHVLGWFPGRIFFFLLISGSFAFRIPQFIDWIQEQLKTTIKRDAIAALVVISLIGHFSRELLLGNVNWLLLVWVFSGFILLKSKPVLSGALFALTLIFKPHFVIIIPWLILRREWTSIKSLAVSVPLLLFLPAIGWGWDDNLLFLKEWIGAMQAHNASLAESANTLYGIPAKLTGIEGSSWIVLFLAVVSFLILAWMLRHFREERANSSLTETNRLLEFSALLAIIPNLVHTDTEHFMW
ncbi:MAG: glycosyltransferase family 87 protein, partial [Flavobacteriales bacterium]|nr:glycosyltransferase family 87 protein [Flavobacteriales bacterium]